MQSESYRKTEQLVLYVRSLQLLSSALQLSRREIQEGRLRTSTSVRTGIELTLQFIGQNTEERLCLLCFLVLRTMKDRFHECLNTCKTLDCAALVSSSTERAIDNISADKLLYSYAIEMCQSAALEELFGRPTEVRPILMLFTVSILGNSLTSFRYILW